MPHRPLNLLDGQTIPGLYIAADGGRPYWVFDNVQGKFAIQLQASEDAPAFSFQDLRKRSLGVGFSFGPVDLHLGQPTAKGAYGRCGIVIAYGWRFHLKVNTERGTSERLIINPYWNDKYVVELTFYEEWSLVSRATGKPVPLFECHGELSRLRPYKRDVPDWQFLPHAWDKDDGS